MDFAGSTIFPAVGAEAGGSTGTLTTGRALGLFGNSVIGVIGAILRVFVSGLFAISAGGLVGSIVSATVGAALPLFIFGNRLLPSHSVSQKGWYDRIMKGRVKPTASRRGPRARPWPGVGMMRKERISGTRASFVATPTKMLRLGCLAGLLYGPASLVD